MVCAPRRSANLSIYGIQGEALQGYVNRLHAETVVAGCQAKQIALTRNRTRDSQQLRYRRDRMLHRERGGSRIVSSDDSAARSIARIAYDPPEQRASEALSAKTRLDKKFTHEQLIVGRMRKADRNRRSLIARDPSPGGRQFGEIAVQPASVLVCIAAPGERCNVILVGANDFEVSHYGSRAIVANHRRRADDG